MRAGKRDRRITLQSASTAPDAAGQPVETWSAFARAWASRRFVRAGERLAAGDQDLAARSAVFGLNWLDGVTEKMRILDTDGAVYDIRGIAGDERENWMELTAEVFDPPPAAT